MLLILTNSYDGTIDLLVPRLPQNSFFRLNCDLVEAYEIEVTNDGFSISDKSGRKITSDQVQKLYYRKLWNNSDDNQSTFSRFQYEEMRYLITEIVNLLWIKNKIVLVEPHAERRCGKLIQLMVAKNYFATPTWGFSYRKIAKTSKALQIVKSLSGEQVDKGKVLYTTQVDPLQLDPKYPWFIQDYIDATKDVTVVFCRGKIFAFELERSFLERSSDWREFISEGQNWVLCQLPHSLCNNIQKYMEHLKLHYGRLDFLLTRENEFFFCEINPNGQYAWLDLDGKHGLLECIVSEISPITPVHPIPHLNPIALVNCIQK